MKNIKEFQLQIKNPTKNSKPAYVKTANQINSQYEVGLITFLKKKSNNWRVN